MVIDKSRKRWRGTEFGDVVEFIREYATDASPVDEVIQCVCGCGGTVFELDGDPDEGCARRTCVVCGQQAFLCDSGEYWDEIRPKKCRCPACRGTRHEVGVGFSLRDPEDERDRGEVRWITVGERCVACGVLGSFADWNIDYSPSSHLLNEV